MEKKCSTSVGNIGDVSGSTNKIIDIQLSISGSMRLFQEPLKENSTGWNLSLTK